MPGLTIHTETGATPPPATTTVEIIPGAAPTISSWHNGLCRVTVHLDETATFTFTGTPGMLRRLFQRLDDEVCSAEVEAEHARALRPYDAAADDWADVGEVSP